MKGIPQAFFALLFPARCLLCGERTAGGADFCPDCAAKAPKEPYRRLLEPAGSGERPLRVLAPFAYRGGLCGTLHRFKFQGRRALAEPLGRQMARVLPREEAGSFDGVAWVPMTAKSRRKRGYDQSFLLAKAVARELGLPCLSLLEKLRETDVQHSLSKTKRVQNIKNAYGAAPNAAGKKILLIDDIVTTGATLTECARQLYRAGAKEVVCLCAADTPADGT